MTDYQPKHARSLNDFSEIEKLLNDAHLLFLEKPGTIRNKRAIEVHVRLEACARILREGFPSEWGLRARVQNLLDRLAIEIFDVIPPHYTEIL